MARPRKHPFSRYGMEWEPDCSDIEVELVMYARHCSTREQMADHMERAFKLIFPEPDFMWDKWTRHFIDIWCGAHAPDGKHKYFTILGPSSIGKTARVAACALIDWWSRSRQTRTVICTNQANKLADRIWGEMVKLHDIGSKRLLKVGINPGKINAKQMILSCESSKDPRACIKGVAIAKCKNHQDAVGRIIGAHMPFNRIIVDEEHTTPLDVITDACVNMSASGEFKKGGLGNPYSFFDNMCIQCEPVNGWADLSPDDADGDGFLRMENKVGMTYFFDGRKNPGMDDPVKYWFYLTPEKFEETKRSHGEDSEQYWQMRIGWPLGERSGQTVITEKECLKFHVTAEPVWKEPPLPCATFDPGFSNGGDRGIYYNFDVGTDADGRTVLYFRKKSVQIKVNVSDREKMVSDQISDRVKLELHNAKVPNDRFVMDASSVTLTLADAVQKAIGEDVKMLRIDNAAAASDRRVSEMDPRIAKDVYSNRVTELWMIAAEFIKADMIRGLTPEAVNQLCSRRRDRDKTYKKIKVEDKREMKKRIGRSPDDGDAVAMACALVRERMGILPGVATVVSAIEDESDGKGLMGMDYNEDAAYSENPFLV